MLQHPLDPTPRAILFDLDDTLCDYSTAREARLRYAFSLDAAGLPRPQPLPDLDLMIAESIKMHPHGVDHFEALFRKFGLEDPGVAEAAARWYRENRFHRLAYFPNAEDVLRAVRRVEGSPEVVRPVGIITNGPTEVQRAKIDLLGVAELVDFILVSEEFGAAKPDASIFEDALNRTGVAAEETVFVGDSPEHDMAGAYSAGIPTIWVNNVQQAWSMPFPAPDREVRSVLDVPALVGAPPIAMPTERMDNVRS